MEKNEKVFEALLFRLEPDLPDTERRYAQLRLKMVKFFSWRRCEDPDGLADETLSRAIRNISLGEEIHADNPYSYIYGIAKYVFMEYLREKTRRRKLTEDLAEQAQSYSEDWEDCRKLCLQKLPPEKLSLLKQYYKGEEDREVLANALNLSLNALRLQVHRIKQELRACLKECLK